MREAYNFSAGPGMLPETVMRTAQAEFLSYHQEKASIMEISHRGDTFLALLQQAERRVRDLLNVPANYHILFLQGGASAQFFSVPMNLLGKHTSVDYVNTGLWSQKAIAEAKRYTTVNTIATLDEKAHIATIPAFSTWRLTPDAAYVHYTDNETVSGVEFNFIPDVSTLLVCDMSSNIFSRAFDVSRFAVIYAGAQKNIGPSGLALVIVRDDVCDRALPITPSIYNYQTQAKAHSNCNTPPTFSIYMAELCLAWMQAEGGVSALEEKSRRKANKLYQVIDAYPDLYQSRVDKHYRSRMNVTFFLPDAATEARFLAGTTQLNLLHLAGHRTHGGIRASLYNAMPEEGVDLLVDFMQAFAHNR